MDIESGTQSFVIKVWLEDTGEETSRTAWRGHITHVPSGERRYLQGFDDIATFIASHLAEMGVTSEAHRYTKNWLQRLLARHSASRGSTE